jgi:NADPH:quinone reductase
MKAVVCRKWGDPSVLSVEIVAQPLIAPNRVRIDVHAAGVNFADTLMIQGTYQVKPPFPFSPGLEVAGVISEVGDGVTNFKVGDRVVALAEHGGYAEEVVTTASTVMPLPPSVDFVTAAGFPVVYGTSHVALAHRAHLKSGETLLVYGAAGGVGLTAVELGKRMGATVVAVSSTPEKQALTKQYGADHAIGYQSVRDYAKQLNDGRGFDVIFDPVGGEAFETAMRVIAWEGRLLVIGFASGNIPSAAANLPLVKNCSIVGVYWGAYSAKNPAVLRDSLHQLFTWHAQGHLKPHISHTYSLDEAPAAMRALIERTSVGKVVLKVR